MGADQLRGYREADLRLCFRIYKNPVFSRRGSYSGATLLLSVDGSTLQTDKDAILERWTEHNNSVLHRPSSVNDNAINRLPQIECNVLLDEFPAVTETRTAIQHLYSGKAPGADAIPAEVYKADGFPLAEKLAVLLQYM